MSDWNIQREHLFLTTKKKWTFEEKKLLKLIKDKLVGHKLKWIS